MIATARRCFSIMSFLKEHRTFTKSSGVKTNRTYLTPAIVSLPDPSSHQTSQSYSSLPSTQKFGLFICIWILAVIEFLRLSLP